MSNKKYQYPCGEFDDDPKWKCEVGCYCVGCKDCKNYDGTEYYIRNDKKAISIWAKHELNRGGNLNDKSYGRSRKDAWC